MKEFDSRLLQERYDSGYSSGLAMGFGISVLILFGASFALRPNRTDPLIDCGEGPNNGEFNFLIKKDEIFSTKAITSGDEITITGKDPGSMSIGVSENVIVTFPNQIINGTTNISLAPESSITLETNGIIMALVGETTGESTLVSIDAECKT